MRGVEEKDKRLMLGVCKNKIIGVKKNDLYALDFRVYFTLGHTLKLGVACLIKVCLFEIVH